MAVNGGDITLSLGIDEGSFNSQLNKIKGSADGKLTNSFRKLGAVIAAAFSVTAVAQFGTEAVKAAMNLENAMQGVESIVSGQGRSFAQAKEFLQEYISDGLVPATDAATAYKNLAARGYDEEQIKNVMTALKDSAAYGRQSSLTLGQAVASAAEGLKNENSILVDNAGVTKNVAKMWQDYAKSIGVSVNSLTQQQKIQAEVNGIMTETQFQTGDAAKVANSFSGQLSQLSFKFNEFKVALGNAIIPVVQAVLPYITQLLDFLTELANKVGQFTSALFGTKSKQYDQTAKSASSAAKAENQLAQATTNAAESAEKSLASFDDLNTLQSNTKTQTEMTSTTPSVSGSTGQTTEEVQTISPKIKQLADTVKNALKEIWGWLNKFSPMLKGIAAAFAVAFGLSLLAKLAKYIIAIPQLAGVIVAVKTALAGAATVFALTKNPLKAVGAGFQSLWKSFKTGMRNLSTPKKLAVSLVALTATFVTTKNAVYDYVKGNKSLGETLLNIIPVFAAVGVAMYAMLGPFGLVLAAGTALVGAIKGICDAQADLRKEMVNTAFYDGVGTKISYIATVYENSMESIELYNQKTIELGDSLSMNQDKVADVSQELEYYEGILSAGGQLTEEQIETMNAKYDELYSCAKENLDTNFDILISTYGEHLKAAAELSGINIDSMIGDLNRLKGDMDKNLSDLTVRHEELRNKMFNGELTDAEKAEYSNLTSLISDLSTGVSETQTRLNDLVSNIGKIDFQNEEAATDALQQIHDTASKLIEENDSARVAAINSIDNIKNDLQTYLNNGIIGQEEFNEKMEICNEWSAAIDRSYDNKEAEIKQSLSTVYEKLQNEMVKQMQSVELKAKEEFNNMNWWEKFWAGDEGTYVSNALAEYQNSFIKPLEDTIQTAFDDLQINGSAWATSAIENIIKSMYSGAKQTKELQDAMKDVGKDMNKGFADGIKAESDAVTNAMTQTTTDMEKAVRTATDTHSPSKVYEGIGIDIMRGLSNGITGEGNSAVNALQTILSTMHSKIQRFCDCIRIAVNDLVSNMDTTMNSITVTPSGQIRYTSMPKIKVPALARGAVLPPNRAFLSVLGDQKHGRNLEAPEDLIRQIVREETQGTEIDVNVNFGGTMGQLVRLLYPEIKKEQRRSSAW